MYKINKILPVKVVVLAIVLLLSLTLLYSLKAHAQTTQTQSGGVGMQGSISAPAPTQAATITQPSNGSVYTNLPVTVTGFCPNGLLVKIFKNNVFSGSVPCQNGSYSIQIDLFSSRNDLVARVFDDLDQAGPDSNTVTTTFNDNTSRPDIISRVSLTSNYARRGANPQEQLTYPIIISGGTSPYAVTVDWGDGTANDVYTVTSPGEFNIKHKYGQSGVYRVLVKAADKNGTIAYLQLTTIGNGAASQQSQVAGAEATKAGKTVVMWQPAAIALPLIITTFWLGKRFETRRVKRHLERGEHPFGG